MALMRFRSRPRPRTVAGDITADDRRPEHLGDVPPAPPKPEMTAWSISSYPYPATHDATGHLRADEQGDTS